MSILSLILLGLAVSLDGFGVGLAYGVRNLRIPVLSLFIISISSALAILFSMFTGMLAANYLSSEAASMVGGTILVLVGVWIIYQTFINYKQSAAAELGKREIRSASTCRGTKSVSVLSLFTELLKEPQKADFDCSGEISGKEAVVLGVALAMDAFGAGFGAAMMGFNPFITSAAVGISKLILVSSGIHLGRNYLANVLGEKASCVSGFVLIILGLMSLFNLS
ncbi:MAG: sporulation membrane protein YtaF [Firmicutes bacterium HGW-Firmicutes-13]|nr:MAG: sporulation membrane protein YtaF [Firmicutes bacterium HGW-Firmicutes-13]